MPALRARPLGPSKAEAVFQRYRAKYGGNLQGCCLLIADEIIAALGGQAVAGYLTWYDGACRRSHWWAELSDGTVVDPMGDELLSWEERPGREVVHRDQELFRELLPQYEQWRAE